MLGRCSRDDEGGREVEEVRAAEQSALLAHARQSGGCMWKRLAMADTPSGVSNTRNRQSSSWPPDCRASGPGCSACRRSMVRVWPCGS